MEGITPQTSYVAMLANALRPGKKKKNGRPNIAKQMREDAVVIGLLRDASPSSKPPSSSILSVNGTTFDSDDPHTQSRPFPPTLQDAQLYSAPMDVFLSQHRNITPAAYDDSRPVTQVPSMMTQQMKIVDWESDGYHKVATVLTSQLPDWFDKQVSPIILMDSNIHFPAMTLTTENLYTAVQLWTCPNLRR